MERVYFCYSFWIKFIGEILDGEVRVSGDMDLVFIRSGE